MTRPAFFGRSVTIIALLCLTSETTMAQAPISIGLTKQLMFDDHVIDSMNGLKRVVHQAT